MCPEFPGRELLESHATGMVWFVTIWQIQDCSPAPPRSKGVVFIESSQFVVRTTRGVTAE